MAADSGWVKAELWGLWTAVHSGRLEGEAAADGVRSAVGRAGWIRSEADLRLLIGQIIIMVYKRKMDTEIQQPSVV